MLATLLRRSRMHHGYRFHPINKTIQTLISSAGGAARFSGGGDDHEFTSRLLFGPWPLAEFLISLSGVDLRNKNHQLFEGSLLPLH